MAVSRDADRKCIQRVGTVLKTTELERPRASQFFQRDKGYILALERFSDQLIAALKLIQVTLDERNKLERLDD